MIRVRSPSLLEVGALLFSLFVFAGAAAVVSFVFRDPEKPIREAQLADLAALAEMPPTSVTLSRSSSRRALSDTAQVVEFLTLLVEPADIPRHHSHPEDEILVEFANKPQAYLLGRDSQIPYEYWLQIAEPNGTERTLKLFRSEALNSWLLRYGFITRIRH